MAEEKLKLSGNKLMYHQDVLKKWKDNEIFPPVYIQFGPVMGCNHKCLCCYVQDYVKDKIGKGFMAMKDDVYLRFMGEIGDYGVKAIVLEGCGEPMLHKKTPEAIKTAVEHGTDVGMLSNGILIKEKDIPTLMDNLTFLRFSVSGGSSESYSKLHNVSLGSWEKIKNVLRKSADYVHKNNAKCTLGVYTLVYNENLDELLGWATEVKEMGLEYILIKPPAPGLNHAKFVDQVPLEKVNPILDQVEKLADDKFAVMVRRDLFKLQGDCKREYERCLGLPFMCAVDADGSVYSCNWFWGNKEYSYGNLNENTFKEIWESQRKKEIIEKVESPDFDFGNCGECRQNNLNKWLWEVHEGKSTLDRPEGPDPKHINFI